MASNNTVQQGDHLLRIAKAFWLILADDLEASQHFWIWKNKRQNPNVLYPGDLIYIPDRQLRQESRSTDKKHGFVKITLGLKLRWRGSILVARAAFVDTVRRIVAQFRSSSSEVRRHSRTARRGKSSLIGNYRDPHRVVTLIDRKAHRQKLLDHGHVRLRMRAELCCCK